MKRVKVIFIAGAARSGSTLLARILAQQPGFIDVGEMARIWDCGIRDDILCGCGKPFSQCETWGRIMTVGFEGAENSNNDHLAQLYQSVRLLSFLRLALPGGQRALQNQWNELAAGYEKLHLAVASATDSHVIVDTSKFPGYGYVLNLKSALDVYVVHLVRDVRGVANSIKKHSKLRVERSSISWVSNNLFTELLFKRIRGRYLRLRYEDFVRRPEEAIDLILRFTGEPSPASPLVKDHVTVPLAQSHTMGGNLNRFITDSVTIQMDNEWKTELSWVEKAKLVFICWPLVLKYRYWQQ